ncbi:TPA: DUF551 domain-containing protein [Klebsiella aerogenes]|nr:DUF551 domain-containing protein [Klebsiella aerogenes]
MTKSTITRERLQEIAEDGFLKHGESKELARMALAAMDSEPLAWGNGCDKTVPAALRYLAENERPIGGESSFNTAHLYQLAREIELMAEAPLYRHAQPAVSKPWGYTSGILNPAVGMACVTPTRGKNQFPVYIDPQPAPVVMDDEKLRALFDAWFASDCSFDQSPEASEADNIAWRESYWYVWQRCRAAMFQAGNSPAIPGAWIPVSERLPEFGDYLVTDGCDFDVQLFNGEEFIPGFIWEDKITHWMPLPSAPQEVKGE